MTTPEPVTQQHRAEAWRVGDRFGWSCLDCTSQAEDVIDATAAERGAQWHSLHPHGLTPIDPVVDAQDPRWVALRERMQFDRTTLDFILQYIDAADAAAGIRRVPEHKLIGYTVLADNGERGYGSAGSVWPTVEPCENHQAYCQAMVDAGREPFNPGTRYIIVELREVAS